MKLGEAFVVVVETGWLIEGLHKFQVNHLDTAIPFGEYGHSFDIVSASTSFMSKELTSKVTFSMSDRCLPLLASSLSNMVRNKCHVTGLLSNFGKSILIEGSYTG